jgi:tetratricopeptide (TPR) repeat protein
MNLTQSELKLAFLEAAKGPRENGNFFFNRFLYRYNLDNARIALIRGLELLSKCNNIDNNAFARIHKGSLYYWLGIASFRAQEHELAVYFFDCATSEDMNPKDYGDADKVGHPEKNPTPALRFMVLDNESEEQAAKDLVKQAHDRIQELLDNFQNPLTMDDFRNRFLIKAFLPEGTKWRYLVAPFISFCIEWDFRNMLLELSPTDMTTKPIIQVHLFKGCLLFESLLKCNPTKSPSGKKLTLKNVLCHLKCELGLKNIKISEDNFQNIVSDLRKSDCSDLETAINFTGKMRNTLGHNIAWDAKFDKDDYHKMVRMISSSCFHAIYCLYP